MKRNSYIKKKWGFSLVEIVVSVTILVLISMGILSLYNFLLNNTKDLEFNLEAKNYTQYVFDIVNNIDPLQSLGELTLNKPFYINFQDNISSNSQNQLISYVLDPNYRSKNIGFTLYGTGYHEISLISTGIISQVSFNTYKIYTKINNYESTLYLTK